MPELIDGKKFLSAKEAGAIFGYTGDYISKLAREGKVYAKRIGRAWLGGGNPTTRLFFDKTETWKGGV